MHSQETLIRDINHIVTSLEIDHRDLTEETKDHLLCLVEDKMELDGYTNHKEVLQSSRYEIMDLVQHAKRTIEQHKRTDLLSMMVNSVKGESFMICMSFAAIIFVMYLNMGFRWAPDIEAAAFVSGVLFLITRIRIRSRRRVPTNSYANQVIRRYAIFPFIANLGLFTFVLMITKSMYHRLDGWYLEFLTSIPIAIAAIFGGIFLKVLIDAYHHIPKMVKDQNKLNKALKEIGYA
jgi:hypothetical protein